MWGHADEDDDVVACFGVDGHVVWGGEADGALGYGEGFVVLGGLVLGALGKRGGEGGEED